MVFKWFGAETVIGTLATPAIVITLDRIKHSCAHYFLVSRSLSQCPLSNINITCSWLSMLLISCPPATTLQSS
ncbi:hypothetical protein AM410_12765 [Enterobacter cloacae complex sp. FDA-CDC-AR_0164]|nr:hypothetical protein AM410_12765 [Enterobacter cloacae complex sp. FDA-CDC-AR_0164]